MADRQRDDWLGEYSPRTASEVFLYHRLAGEGAASCRFRSADRAQARSPFAIALSATTANWRCTATSLRAAARASLHSLQPGFTAGRSRPPSPIGASVAHRPLARRELSHEPGPGLLQHSDRGSQYTSDDYQRALRAHGIECSFSGRGNCWDNAVVESFFGTLKRELIHRRSWPTRREAADAIHEYIEVFYNRRRRHTTLGGKAPAAFEALAQRQVAQAA